MITVDGHSQDRGGAGAGTPSSDDGVVTVSVAVSSLPRYKTRDEWNVGDAAQFEYHCNQSHDSAHAEWWYRSRQPVTVLVSHAQYPGTMDERSEDGNPNTYRVRWADGFEGDVFEDELLTSAEHYSDAWIPGVRP